MNRFFFIALACLFSATTSAQTPLPAELVSTIDAFVAERMEQGKLPGLSLVIVKDGQVAYTKGYGFANLEEQIAMTDHTPVAVASTAKGMTALAIMQLVEQGKVNLDAPVTTYLPAFKVDDPLSSTITVRQVLSHTAGLPASATYDGNRNSDALDQRVRGLASVKLSRAPGTGYEYANDGYAVAGLIIQTVSGMPFEEYMTQHIFAPLAMQESTFDPAQAEQHGLAQGYLKQRGVISPGPLNISRGQAPAGLLLTSAHDTANYFLMLLSGGQFDDSTIVAKSSIEELWKPHVQLEPELHYGLGWEVSNANGLTVVSHTGSLPASSSDFILVPSQNLGVAVMVNLSSVHTVEIAEGVIVLMQGSTPNPSSLPTEREPSTFKPDPSVWTQYLGDYESQKGSVHIYVEDGKLMGRAGDVDFELEAYGDNDFVMRGNVGAFEGFAVSFSSDDSYMIMLLGGQPFGQKK
jgi:CubicO group peptidase (beta-lactamase class C family)